MREAGLMLSNFSITETKRCANGNAAGGIFAHRYIIGKSHASLKQTTPGELVGSGNRSIPMRGGAPPMAARNADRYFELKSQIHRKLIGVLNLERASSIPKD